MKITETYKRLSQGSLRILSECLYKISHHQILEIFATGSGSQICECTLFYRLVLFCLQCRVNLLSNLFFLFPTPHRPSPESTHSGKLRLLWVQLIFRVYLIAFFPIKNEHKLNLFGSIIIPTQNNGHTEDLSQYQDIFLNHVLCWRIII